MTATFYRSTALTLMLLAAIHSSAHAGEQDGMFYGLLRARDLTPFGFVRLDMRPGHAVSIEPGDWAIETELAYQNTWAVSPQVEHYLNGLEGTGRRKLGRVSTRSSAARGSAGGATGSGDRSSSAMCCLAKDGERPWALPRA